MGDANNKEEDTPPFLKGGMDDIVPEDDLPFERVKPTPTEETMEDIRTGM
jgi:hypothetical protein